MNGTRIYFLHIIKASRKWCINKLIIYLERFQIKMIFKIAVWDIHVDVDVDVLHVPKIKREN